MAAWQGLFDNVYGVTHALQVDINPLRRKLTRVLKRKSMKVLNELMQEVNGAAVGDAALAEHVRVKGIAVLQNDVGGVRPIETVDLLDRVTATADTTMIAALLTETRNPSTYPTDPSGNGGGGKLGY